MSERVEFKAPKGVVPEDVAAGDTFDLVSTYRLKPDGQICLVQIGDHKMAGYEEDEYEQDTKNKNRASYGDVMASMHSAMSDQGGGSGNTDMGGGGSGGY